jgi:VanZ family protein
LPQATTEYHPATRTWFPAGAWKQWIPALIWITIITFESTDLFSAEHTGSALYSVVTQVFGPVNPLTFDIWHHYLRKVGHFVGFFILSYLLFCAWRATLPARGLGLWSLPWARVSFLMSVMIATLDEWHQTTIPSRTGNFHDVILDSSAALAAQFCLWVVFRKKYAGCRGLLRTENSGSGYSRKRQWH